MEYNEVAENSAELLKAQYEKEAGLGRGIIRNANFRKDNRLAAFINPAKFPKEDILGTKPLEEGEAVTEEQVEAAKRASLSIVFEAVLQVLEYRPQSTQVVDKPQSLNDIKKALQEGFARFDKMGKSGGLEELRKIAVVAFERRNKDTQGLEKIDPEKLSAWLGKVFRDAYAKIAQKEQAIASYGEIRSPSHQ
jgi:hypothetical protein